MKSKKRHQTSSEDSEESDVSLKSSSSSGSGSDDSSLSEHRHKKKRKRADSSQSESESDDQKRTKKRKHKKKKKKHGKKKRRSTSPVGSISAEELSSVSEGELSSKKKRKQKHKHSKRAHSSSVSGDDRVERRLHSVVKERRASSEEGSQPSRTYYQRQYRQSGSGEEYDREREVQRFYRGSSKERRHQLAQHQYERERNDKYAAYQNKNNDREKYVHGAQNNNSNDEYNQRRQREYDEYKRQQRYEERRPAVPDEYQRRPPREETYSREDARGYNQNNRYNQQYVDRAPKKQYDDSRDHRERRGPPEPDRFREREYPEKKERYQEAYTSDRSREVPRERISRPEKPAVSHQKVSREPSKSKSPEDRERNKERARRPDHRDEREARQRDARGDERRARPAPGADRKPLPDRERPARSADRKPLPDRERPARSADRKPLPDRERPARSADRKPLPDRERPARSADRKQQTDRDRPPVAAEARGRDRRSRFGAEDGKEYSWGKAGSEPEAEKGPGDKEKPNFGLSGKLTADANTFNGVVIKYAEPEDAKQPKRRWRFYPFKGDKALPILYIHRQSAFLIGRDKKVADIFVEHPSISKQHAALQYRATPFARADGSQGRRVRPYIIDLESANGTFVNNKKVEPRRYVELLERDVVKFGFSAREYVLLHENSKDDAQDDDNQEVGITTTDQIKMEKRVKQEVVEDGE